ncbi:APC family permease [Deinococcus cavernae]|uniref:APC family permease n=2 Tax=Deinococcus cavernae TaxID=2320857 RepID=A0A418VGT7_9DEIO|nr:APC family permease [Deinococcus cavernae]
MQQDTKPEQPGSFEEPSAVKADHVTEPWWKVMCLTGVDYFSTLGYQPGIAALAAGAVAPLATLVLVLVTLFGALPMYRRVAGESPHGDGSISMLERLMSYWPSKLLVLVLIGFVATGFIVTITLSGADAAAHMVENPLLSGWLRGQQVSVTLLLVLMLGAVFLKGFKEAIGIAVVLVGIYLALSLAVVVRGLMDIAAHPQVLSDWQTALSQGFHSPLALIGAALLVFPKLALGLSGFETGVLVMPLVRGDASDTEARPSGRIRNAKKLLTTAALIMSVMLVSSSLVTTLLVPRHEFWAETTVSSEVNSDDLKRGIAVVNVPLDSQTRARDIYAFHVPPDKTGAYTFPASTVGGPVDLAVSVTPAGPTTTVQVSTPPGKANGRALAYVAHERLGETFGTAYDISTILILWFAGASAMAGLLNIVPRFLPRYGMAPEWSRAHRPLVLLYTAIAVIVTLAFKANVDAQAAAYATGVLAMMTSAAVAVTLIALRRRERGPALAFGLISAVFIYTSAVTVLSDPKGLYLALVFIALVLVVGITSRVSRSFELRVSSVQFDDTARELLQRFPIRPLRFVSHHPGREILDDYKKQEMRVRQMVHLPYEEPFIFLEVEVDDASEFADVVEVSGHMVGPYGVLKARGSSIPNTIAAVMLHLRGKDGQGVPPQVYMRWTEEDPVQLLLDFIIGGRGDVPPLTREILRRAEPDRERRPIVHVGG